MSFFKPVIDEHEPSLYHDKKIRVVGYQDTVVFAETLILLSLVFGQNLFRKAEATVNYIVGYFCCRTRKCRTSDDLPKG